MPMSGLNLPYDVPWRLIAVSRDMMDPTFCNEAFPYVWRSSLAISVFEPTDEDLLEQHCGKQLTYLKVSATITGYQPTPDETELAYVSFPDVPTEKLDRLIRDYFACYGVLLHIGVFPVSDSRAAAVTDYPHIIDFEPKNRDLYQVSSDTGELLTGSASKVLIDKTMAHTDSTEFELSKGIEYTSPESGYGQFKGTNEFSPKWGWSNSDSSAVNTEGSRDRRERYGSTTTVTQMYNLLKGYHVGTNRAVFLMLPRPHQEQPTPRRTFVRGVREIEGIQEFFLVVERSPDTEGLCIEARLETGHFPEQVEIEIPQPEYFETEMPWHVSAYARGGGGFDAAESIKIEEFGNGNSSATFRAPVGWIIDRTKGDPGHPGVRFDHDNGSNQQAKDSLTAHFYGAIDDSTAQVRGIISGKYAVSGAIFEHEYTVFLRSEQPKKTDDEPKIVSDTLLITSRDLCVCYRSVDGCPSVIEPDADQPTTVGVSIVDEPKVSLPVSTSEAGGAATLWEIRNALVSSSRMPSRRRPGTVGFLESDYFTRRIAAELPEEGTEARLSMVVEIARTPVFESMSVGHLLTTDLGRLSATTGLDAAELAQLRRLALGLPIEEHRAPTPEPGGSTTDDPK
jgi:hypothetical protein